MISLLLIGATCAAVLVPYWFIQVIRKRRWITLGFMVVPNGYFVIRCISELTTQLPNAFGKFFLFTMILGLMFASSAIILLVDAVIGFAIRIVHKKKVIKETL